VTHLQTVTTRLTALGVVLCIPSSPGIAQDAVADFYRGKQINLVVSTGPGGSASLYAQATARHMGRHLPGHPNIIVQHVPGAGGLVAANAAYSIAPRDGSVIYTTGRTVPLDPLLGAKAANFDGRRFNYIGTANVEYTTCISWHSAPVKTLQDAFEKELVVGGYGDGVATVFPRAANKLAGTRFKVITGYQGSPQILLAMERGEIEGFCAIGWTYLKLRKPDWLRDKKINVLYQMALTKHPDIPDVPAIIDYAKTPEDRKAFEFLFAPQEMGRPFFAPPGVPADRVKALRTAFERVLHDPQFLAEADKMGLEVQHRGGEHVQALVDRIYASPPDVIARAKAAAE
jgi:tripartite-type tricarboxylate transporter receptor subunit TctC